VSTNLTSPALDGEADRSAEPRKQRRRSLGLTAAQVERETEPGRYCDGHGLYLLQKATGSKSWIFRYTLKGQKMREMGLGPAAGPLKVSLKDARRKAWDLHRMVHEGRDPLAERDAAEAEKQAKEAREKAATMTFRACAVLYHEAQRGGWSDKHAADWATSTATYAYPVLGDMPVGTIGTDDVMAVLKQIWDAKNETARRVRAQIEQVLDFARSRGWRNGENPARWRGHLSFNLTKNRPPVKHHATLHWREIGAFVRRLRANGSVTAQCLEFTILTAVRTGEVLGARWSEIDLEQRVWTIPAERMKAKKNGCHRVPLSERAVAILEMRKRLASPYDADFVFPGQKLGHPLSDRALYRLAPPGKTVHGNRSAFKDWSAEATNHPREVVEMALAHRVGNAVEQAYFRSDLFAKRRKLMSDWANFICRPMPEGDNVVDAS
jgi:integrase